jgi:hypothetical protein
VDEALDLAAQAVNAIVNEKHSDRDE